MKIILKESSLNDILQTHMDFSLLALFCLLTKNQSFSWSGSQTGLVSVCKCSLQKGTEQNLLSQETKIFWHLKWDVKEVNVLHKRYTTSIKIILLKNHKRWKQCVIINNTVTVNLNNIFPNTHRRAIVTYILWKPDRIGSYCHHSGDENVLMSICLSVWLSIYLFIFNSNQV